MTNHTPQQLKIEFPTVKLCECGCGTLLQKPKYPSEQRRFIRGHQNRRPLLERFWEKVDKNGPNGCWIWIGGKGLCGHGKFWFNGKLQQAHRVSWKLHYGPIPNDVYCLHKCPADVDNPSCVNPTHLYLGDRADNIADAIAKNMLSRGERHPPSKLTANDIRIIRKRYEAGETQKDIALDYPVDRRQIGRIVRRKTWKHVT